jgi:ADP-ribose pyrophosphatase
LPSGIEQDLLWIRHPGAVAVAPLTDKGELLLVRQYRHAVRAITLELPAGRREAGEDPLAAARRELAEETGHRARDWQALGSFWPAPGFCSERVFLFAARGLEPAAQALDADEDLEVVRMSPERALRESEDAKTLLAIQRLLAGS